LNELVGLVNIRHSNTTEGFIDTLTLQQQFPDVFRNPPSSLNTALTKAIKAVRSNLMMF